MEADLEGGTPLVNLLLTRLNSETSTMAQTKYDLSGSCVTLRDPISFPQLESIWFLPLWLNCWCICRKMSVAICWSLAKMIGCFLSSGIAEFLNRPPTLKRPSWQIGSNLVNLLSLFIFETGEDDRAAISFQNCCRWQCNNSCFSFIQVLQS